jgi:GT2 family glycosyltransferase
MFRIEDRHCTGVKERLLTDVPTPNAAASHTPQATVVITTKNRKDDLRKAVASALMQDANPRVLVIDDGSNDGTSEMVRGEFPTVRLERSQQSRGYIVQRNYGAALAQTPFIFSIDDDAVFSSPRVVSAALAAFDHPRVGVVGIPYIRTQEPGRVHQLAPDVPGVFPVDSYTGTAYALRRELFLRVGGYREFLFHLGEEEDYSIRMLAAGYVVRQCRTDPIHHFESPLRDFTRIDLYGRRNNVLFAWCNVPMPYLPMHLLGTTWNGLKKGWKARRMMQMARGLAMGYAAIFTGQAKRHPVPAAVYRLHRRLRHGHTSELREIENSLPPMT